jgi:hypothetical protein
MHNKKKRIIKNTKTNKYIANILVQHHQHIKKRKIETDK